MIWCNCHQWSALSKYSFSTSSSLRETSASLQRHFWHQLWPTTFPELIFKMMGGTMQWDWSKKGGGGKRAVLLIEELLHRVPEMHWSSSYNSKDKITSANKTFEVLWTEITSATKCKQSRWEQQNTRCQLWRFSAEVKGGVAVVPTTS